MSQTFQTGDIDPAYYSPDSYAPLLRARQAVADNGSQKFNAPNAPHETSTAGPPAPAIDDRVKAGAGDHEPTRISAATAPDHRARHLSASQRHSAPIPAAAGSSMLTGSSITTAHRVNIIAGAGAQEPLCRERRVPPSSMLPIHQHSRRLAQRSCEQSDSVPRLTQSDCLSASICRAITWIGSTTRPGAHMSGCSTRGLQPI